MTIVVGVDGSPVARRALAWAIAEGRLRGTDVRAVYAWHVPLEAPVGATVLGAPLVESGAQELRVLQQAAERRLGDELAAVGGGAVERRALPGPAADVLVEQARDADLLVVGSHGHGAIAGALLGSVSQACSRRAGCPVVIVRDAPAAAHAPGWQLGEVIARELAQNAQSWEALRRLGVHEGDELPLEFVYESGGERADGELADHLRGRAGYEVALERGGVTGMTPSLPLGPAALEAWVRGMVWAGYEHGGCVFCGWTATLAAGRV